MKMHRKGPQLWVVAVCLTALCFLINGSSTAYASETAQIEPKNDSCFFPETGYTVQGIFLDYWVQHGGLAQQGYPISKERQEVSPTDGKIYTVQYFERAIFELHSEKRAPNSVLLSLLGRLRYEAKYGDAGAPGQQANTLAGSVLFEKTGKRVGDQFLEYWNKNGELAQQGLPISDEFNEQSDLDGKTYKVQYFERAVFEYHPEISDPKHKVLLSQLGTFRLKSLSAPTPHSTKTDWEGMLRWLMLWLIPGIVAVVLVWWGKSVSKPVPYSPTLVVLAPFGIMLAVTGTVISFILQLKPFGGMVASAGGSAAIIGLLLGVAAWLVAGLVYSYLGLHKVDAVNPGSYGLLRCRLEVLNAKLNTPPPTQPLLQPGDPALARQFALNEAIAQRDFLCNALNQNLTDPRVGSLQWVSGYGYIELWRSLHHAEEELIMVEPKDALTGYVMDDRLRLEGSEITNRDYLLNALRYGAAALGLPTEISGITATPAAQGVAPTEGQIIAARATLRQVRSAINNFRDSSWEGIVRARNYRTEAVTFTGIAAYLLLVASILPDVLTKPLQAATVFFLVGATVGLFNQLRAGVESNTYIDDYGLWHSRLVSTPIFSGLAALGGVVLLAMLPKLLNAEAITPQTTTPIPTITVIATIPTPIATEVGIVRATEITLATSAITATQSPSPTDTASPVPPTPVPATSTPTPIPGAAAAPEHLPAFIDIFSLERNLFGLLVAAMFGLAPSLLLSALQKQVNKYNLDIQSTEPQERSRSSNP